MRIGTWNMEGKWSPDHLTLLRDQECEVWLLTEVHVEASIPGMTAHRTDALMGPRKNWAAIFSVLDAAAERDPHPATAMVRIDGSRILSSVLPWRSCGSSWEGSSLAEKFGRTLTVLGEHIDDTTIWGGDWNQGLEGAEYVGSLDGRRQVVELVREKRLSVPTGSLGSASKGQRSIDHIAVPIDWDVDAAYRVSAYSHGLSDHDAYVISVDR